VLNGGNGGMSPALGRERNARSSEAGVR
jgi:hypothetical protein